MYKLNHKKIIKPKLRYDEMKQLNLKEIHLKSLISTELFKIKIT